MKPTKVVHGILLEQRICVCGCGHSFWVKQESEQQHRSTWCKDGGSIVWGFDKEKTEETGKRGRPPAELPPGTVSVKGLAKLQGVSVNTVYGWIKQDRVPYRTLPSGEKCFEPEAVAKAVESFQRLRRRRSHNFAPLR